MAPSGDLFCLVRPVLSRLLAVFLNHSFQTPHLDATDFSGPFQSVKVF
jgi:hypothetical protein